MNVTQDFIARYFDQSYANEAKARIRDNRRERAASSSVCCAPEMCPTCFDNGGHAR